MRITAANAQLADLQNRRQSLEADIQLATDHLLAERETVLTGLTEKHMATIKTLEQSIAELDSKQSIAEEQLVLVESELPPAQDRLLRIQTAVKEAENDKTMLSMRLEGIKKEIIPFIRRKEELQREISGLTEAKVLLLKEIDRSTAIEVSLEADIASLETKKQQLYEDTTAMEEDITAKLRIKRIQLEELQTYEQQTRADLASRELSVEDRERVVAIRERKADSQEHAIQQNASLLDL